MPVQETNASAAASLVVGDVLYVYATFVVKNKDDASTVANKKDIDAPRSKCENSKGDEPCKTTGIFSRKQESDINSEFKLEQKLPVFDSSYLINVDGKVVLIGSIITGRIAFAQLEYKSIDYFDKMTQKTSGLLLLNPHAESGDSVHLGCIVNQKNAQMCAIQLGKNPAFKIKKKKSKNVVFDMPGDAPSVLSSWSPIVSAVASSGPVTAYATSDGLHLATQSGEHVMVPREFGKGDKKYARTFEATRKKFRAGGKNTDVRVRGITISIVTTEHDSQLNTATVYVFTVTPDHRGKLEQSIQLVRADFSDTSRTVVHDFARTENTADLARYTVYKDGGTDLLHAALVNVEYGIMPRLLVLSKKTQKNNQAAYSWKLLKPLQNTLMDKMRPKPKPNQTMYEKVQSMKSEPAVRSIVSASCFFEPLLQPGISTAGIFEAIAGARNSVGGMTSYKNDTGCPNMYRLLEKSSIRFDPKPFRSEDRAWEHARLHLVMQKLSAVSSVSAARSTIPSFVLSMPTSVIDPRNPILYTKKDSETVGRIISGFMAGKAGSFDDAYANYTQTMNAGSKFVCSEREFAMMVGNSNVLASEEGARSIEGIVQAMFQIASLNPTPGSAIAGVFNNHCRQVDTINAGNKSLPLFPVPVELKCYMSGTESTKHPVFNGSDPAPTRRVSFDHLVGTEKFDGIRARWHPTKQAFLVGKRSDRLTVRRPPNSWLRQLREIGMFLDGELWAGRGRFYQTQGLLNSASWSELRYVVFDSNDDVLKKEGYACRMNVVTKRIEQAQQIYNNNHKPRRRFYVLAAPMFNIAGKNSVVEMLMSVLRINGEGLVLRHNSAGYADAGLIKVKVQNEITAETFEKVRDFKSGTSLCRAYVVSPRGRTTDETLYVSGVPSELSSGARIVVAYASRGLNDSYLHARYERTRADQDRPAAEETTA